jgi:hypothetical protein
MMKSLEQLIRKKLPKSYQEKAKNVILSIKNGESYKLFNGKRFKVHTSLVGIPLGLHFRILCRFENEKLVPWKLLTHAEYDRYGQNLKTGKC